MGDDAPTRDEAVVRSETACENGHARVICVSGVDRCLCLCAVLSLRMYAGDVGILRLRMHLSIFCCSCQLRCPVLE